MSIENCQIVLNKCSLGLYVISSHLNKKINAQISDALMQITSCPPKVALTCIFHDKYQFMKIF